VRRKGPYGRWLSATELPPKALPAHMTNDKGEPIDLDAMLQRLHLMGSHFAAAPSHRKHRKATHS
jgi:hypothetical protein